MKMEGHFVGKLTQSHIYVSTLYGIVTSVFYLVMAIWSTLTLWLYTTFQ